MLSPRKAIGKIELGRLVRAGLTPAILSLPALFWVIDATRRASFAALGRDQGIFQYVAWALSRGEIDYRDVRDVNGPLTHFVHAAFLVLGGADEHRFRILDLLITGATFGLVGACLPGATRVRSRASTAPAEPGPADPGAPSPAARIAWAVAAAVVLGAQYLQYDFWHSAQRESFFDWLMLPSVALQLVAQCPTTRPRGRSIALTMATGALSVAPWFGKPTYALFTLLQLAVLAAEPPPETSRLRALAAFGGGALLGLAGLATL